MKPTLPAGPLDWLMDKSLLLGYTKIGPVVRRHWWPPDVLPGALAGEHVLVTGASGVLGLAAAVGIARLGATVHLVGRRHDRLVTARAAALHQVPTGRFELAECDVSDLDAVRGFCAEFAARTPQLRALVHNAGVMPPSRTTSAQGHELTLATHVLGPHLMTTLLADTLGGGRVVVVSSGGMYGQGLPTSDFEYERGTYSGVTAYARAKRMQVALPPLWAADLGPRGVDVQAMHPGWAATPGVTDALPGSPGCSVPSCAPRNTVRTRSSGSRGPLRASPGGGSGATAGRAPPITLPGSASRARSTGSGCGSS